MKSSISHGSDSVLSMTKSLIVPGYKGPPMKMVIRGVMPADSSSISAEVEDTRSESKAGIGIAGSKNPNDDKIKIHVKFPSKTERKKK